MSENQFRLNYKMDIDVLYANWDTSKRRDQKNFPVVVNRSFHCSNVENPSDLQHNARRNPAPCQEDVKCDASRSAIEPMKRKKSSGRELSHRFPWQ